MTTRFIGIKEFRQNMARIASTASKKNQRLIVMRKNRPLFELRPLSKETVILEELMHDIEKARDDVRNGRTYTTAQVRKMLKI